MIQQFDSLMQMMETFSDEQVCIDHLRAIRWKDGAYCPSCGSAKVYHFSDNRTHKCGDCRQRFSIKVGTIFEDTKLPLRKWFMAIWIVTSHTKGIASTQLAMDIQITQKSAWFMLHRLRHAVRTQSFNKPLDGMVEADETYVGGKEKNKHAHKKTPGSQGGANKAVVMGQTRSYRTFYIKTCAGSGPSFRSSLSQGIFKASSKPFPRRKLSSPRLVQARQPT